MTSAGIRQFLPGETIGWTLAELATSARAIKVESQPQCIWRISMLQSDILPPRFASPPWLAAIQRWHYAASCRRFFVQRAASHEGLAVPGYFLPPRG